MNYLTVSDVMSILGISSSKAYAVMRELNNQLKEKGYITIAGKVPIKFFCEHYYADPEQIKKQISTNKLVG